MANSSEALPTGTLTFLFTDIEGSTQLWEKHPEAMKAALARHDSTLREAVESNGGHVIKKAGDGMLAVFETAGHGIAATLAAQRALSKHTWDEIQPQALTLLGAAEALRVLANSAMTPVERVEYDALVAALRVKVSDDKFKQRWNAGRTMNMDQAVEYALEAAHTVA